MSCHHMSPQCATCHYQWRRPACLLHAVRGTMCPAILTQDKQTAAPRSTGCVSPESDITRFTAAPWERVALALALPATCATTNLKAPTLHPRRVPPTLPPKVEACGKYRFSTVV